MIRRRDEFWAGVAAELILLPALLAGPLGRLCSPPVANRRPAGRPTISRERTGAQLPAHGAAVAASGVTPPHITGLPRPPREGSVIRRDRGHGTGGR